MFCAVSFPIVIDAKHARPRDFNSCAVAPSVPKGYLHDNHVHPRGCVLFKPASSIFERIPSIPNSLNKKWN